MATILTPIQSNFLIEFFHLTQEFYLTGGTALSAFYLQHRFSEDLDLFTQDDQAFQHGGRLAIAASTNLHLECTPVRITSYFKHFLIGLPVMLRSRWLCLPAIIFSRAVIAQKAPRRF
jgi:hypothetical protein